MRDRRQRGISLIMVMLILVIVSLLGIGGIQVSMMGERSARNDRDSQIAWQGAEAALLDAEFDIRGAEAGSGIASPRSATLSPMDFVECQSSGSSAGLCLVTGGKSAWLTVDFADTSSGATTTAFGAFTTRTFASGGAGIQPAQAPRYVVELVPDKVGDKAIKPAGEGGQTYVYRVTAMGFGPRTDIQTVAQMLFRK